MAARTRVDSSESVLPGHPDKVADQISDAILDACLRQDPASRVAVETLVKGGHVILAGEITTRAEIDLDALVRQTIRRIGYDDDEKVFSAEKVRVIPLLTLQAAEIGRGVDGIHGTGSAYQGAGDQGVMYGYATNESAERLPLPIALAHRITQAIEIDRSWHRIAWAGLDGKAQVSVRYERDVPVAVDTVVVSLQHDHRVDRQEINRYVTQHLVPNALGCWYERAVTIHVNPAGSFLQGGPEIDAGLTGRKIMVDTYGGLARHGGGAFSGKDASKVDRSAAYLARMAARTVVDRGLARRCEVQVAYAIGIAKPVAIAVDTFGTGRNARAIRLVEREFDFRPGAIVERLQLTKPQFEATARGGHFGRLEFPWERVA